MTASSRACRVLPPLVGGLHCGAVLGVLVAQAHGGAPAARRRAPLRRSGDAGTTQTPGVLPLVGGLHCGVRSSCENTLNGASCSRRSSAGSIAAPLVRPVRRGWLVLPPLV